MAVIEKQEFKQEYIPVNLVRASPFQPRVDFDDEEIDALASSLKEVGLIHPIVVRKIEMKGELLYYELISGERRLRAAKSAGFKTIEAKVLMLSDSASAKLALIENVQRVDLNPLEIAISLKKLMDIFSMSQEEVAQKVGKKRSTVANYLRLLSLPKDIQEGITSGKITMGHAKAILSLPEEESKEKLYALIEDEKMTVREAERESQRLVLQKKESPKLDEVKSLQRAIEEHFQTKVELAFSKDKKRGRIVLHFYSLDDLERLSEKAGIDIAKLS